MIDKIYVNEAIRIREEFLLNLLYISSEENNIKSLISQLEEIKENIEGEEKINEDYYKKTLHGVEKLLIEATEKLTPFQDKTKVLDGEQRKLYNNIKEKYTKLSDDDIINEIAPSIIEFDEKFRIKHNINNETNE